MTRLFKYKSGVKQTHKRILIVTQGDKFSLNIKLKTSFKKSELWLSYGEIKRLKEQYNTIKELIKDVWRKLEPEYLENENKKIKVE